MKRLFLFTILVLSIPGTGHAAVTLVARGPIAQSSTNMGVTTAALDTHLCVTNCMEAVCWAGYDPQSNTITDSLNNNWILADQQNIPGQSASQLWIAFNPSVGAAQTFTAANEYTASSVVPMAFNGVASGPDQKNGSTATSSPISTGSVTPTNANELIIPCLSSYGGSGYTVSSPFDTHYLAADWSQSDGSGLGTSYLIQTTATAENATWTLTGAVSDTTALIDTFYSTASPATLVPTVAALPEGFNGVAYNFCLTATGGIQPYTWSKLSGTYPTGLSLSTGCLTGTPSTGTETLDFQVEDSASVTAATGNLPVTIAAAILQITTMSCPVGTQGSAYAGCTLAASGATPPYTFSVDSSGNYPTLPEGTALNSSTGAITGSAIGGMGNYTPGLIVTDSLAATAEDTSIEFSITGNSGFMASIFPPNSIFHHRVDAASTGLPVDTSPAAPIYSAYLTATIKPLFGADEAAPFPGGIPAFYVPYNQSNVTVATTLYQSYFTSGPIPANAPIEGTASGVGQDQHVLIYQQAGGGNPSQLWEMWQSMQTGGGNWTDSSNAYWPNAGSTGTNVNALTAQGMGTTDAAGLPVAPLLLNADEVIGTGTPSAPNGTVQHPTRLTVNHGLNYWVWPATQSAGVGSCDSIPPESLISQSSPPASCTFSGAFGEIYRLKASVNNPSCAATSPQAAIIILGLRNYGAILVDNGVSGFIIGTPDPRWNDTDLTCLERLHLSDFEPVNVSSLIVSNDSGETPPIIPPPVPASAGLAVILH